MSLIMLARLPVRVPEPGCAEAERMPSIAAPNIVRCLIKLRRPLNAGLWPSDIGVAPHCAKRGGGRCRTRTGDILSVNRNAGGFPKQTQYRLCPFATACSLSVHGVFGAHHL